MGDLWGTVLQVQLGEVVIWGGRFFKGTVL